MYRVKKFLVVACFTLAASLGCSNNPSVTQEAENGSVTINLVADAKSDFAALARTAEVKISAEGMITLVQPLTVTPTGISGSISGIAAGSNRKFEVFVYDEANKVCYYGSANSTVTAGGTANVVLTLYQSSGEGNATISGSIVSTNVPPVVTLTVNNTQFRVGDVIQLAATASDADGTISNVRFYNGATLINTDNAAPFTYSFTAAAAGTVTLSAVATDNGNASTTSAAITVTVTDVNAVSYKINAGGAAVSPYAADSYYSGGSTASITSTISLTGVTNPAPQAVYQKERYGAMTYTFPGLAAGASYMVRLHFAELYWTAAAKRKFNVAINGSSVLSNFDIYVAASGSKKAIVREFSSIANANGQIVIGFTNVTDNAQICGIEILPPATYTITYTQNGGTGSVPVDNTAYASGATATVKANPGALVNGSSSFAGWNTSGGTTYACGQQITITGNITLSAKYSATDVMDNDGNLYTSILIGGKRWLLQSLKTTKYRDGTAINYFVTNGNEWRLNAVVGGSPTCAWAGFSSSNSNLGMMYNSIAVGNRAIAPAGWRIATQADWEDLYSAANNNACQLINWTNTCSGSPGELNLTGFNLSESGYIYQWENDPGYWNNSNAFLWTSNPTETYVSFGRAPGGVFISYYDIYSSANNARGYGCAIRCVKE